MESTSDSAQPEARPSQDVWGGGPPEAAGVEIRSVAPGSRLRLADGSIVEVTDNPGDGYWVVVRYLSSVDGTAPGKQDLVFYQDVVGKAD
jgi:hypothetical protein